MAVVVIIAGLLFTEFLQLRRVPSPRSLAVGRNDWAATSLTTDEGRMTRDRAIHELVVLLSMRATARFVGLQPGNLSAYDHAAHLLSSYTVQQTPAASNHIASRGSIALAACRLAIENGCIILAIMGSF